MKASKCLLEVFDVLDFIDEQVVGDAGDCTVGHPTHEVLIVAEGVVFEQLLVDVNDVGPGVIGPHKVHKLQKEGAFPNPSLPDQYLDQVLANVGPDLRDIGGSGDMLQ
jgi:hypothetical protein